MRKRRPSTFLACCISFIILGINPSACSKACSHSEEGFKGCKACTGEEGCARTCNEGEGCGKACNTGEGCHGCGKGCKCSKGHSDIHGDKALSTAETNYTYKQADGSYHYNNQSYRSFTEIPFSINDKIHIDGPLSPEQAEYLIDRNITFVYNTDVATQQKSRRFKIILLISDNINTVRHLYELDAVHAKKIIDYTGDLRKDIGVIKVESYDQMLDEQRKLLDNNEVPVVVFHNSSSVNTRSYIEPGSNVITCNSFEISPTSYLTSTDLLDIRGIIKGLNQYSSQQTLEEFYQKFTDAYYTHMYDQNRKKTLVAVGVVGGTAAGVGLIAYYNKS